MNPRLVAVSGSLPGDTRPISQARLAIGRDRANDLCLTDAGVSRQHCVIDRTDEGCQISDLASHNGTFVNGQPVTRTMLHHGDAIRIGGSEYIFLVQEESEQNTNLSLTEESLIGQLSTIRLEEPIFGASADAEIGRS